LHTLPTNFHGGQMLMRRGRKYQVLVLKGETPGNAPAQLDHRIVTGSRTSNSSGRHTAQILVDCAVATGRSDRTWQSLVQFGLDGLQHRGTWESQDKQRRSSVLGFANLQA